MDPLSSGHLLVGRAKRVNCMKTSWRRREIADLRLRTGLVATEIGANPHWPHASKAPTETSSEKTLRRAVDRVGQIVTHVLRFRNGLGLQHEELAQSGRYHFL